MPSYIEPAVIDVNPTTLKPILFTTYKPVVKYNIEITYEDSTTKTVELVQGDKNRPYKVVFKKEGKLITAIGVPKIYEVSESCKFCDFTNRVMDSDDLLIELDCSSEYECTKVRFYLKDIRDIIDLAVEGDEDGNTPDEIILTRYPIYLNGFDCSTKIYCKVDDESKVFLHSQITKLGEQLNRDEYSNFMIFTVNGTSEIELLDPEDDETTDNAKLLIPEELYGTEIKLIIRYFVNEINHPVFDEFTIIPITEDSLDDDGNVLTRAVTTADMQYLGDGLKTALGVGLTPGYKQYRNSKNYTGSVMIEE